MLFKLIFASLVGVAVCELFDAEFFPFALLARALRGNTRRRQRTRYSFPRLQGRRPPGRMTTGVAVPPRVMSDPADISNMLGKTIRIYHEFVDRIDNSVPRVTA